MSVLNPLEHGTRCVVTTRDGQIISGWFRGIEVPHGDQAILVESTVSTHSIPIRSVLTASTTDRRGSRRTSRPSEEPETAIDARDGRDLTVAIVKPRSR